MPCPSSGIPFEPSVKFDDFLAVHPFTAGRYRPRNKAELVAAVTGAAAKHQSLRALGSQWSLSGAHTAQIVVDTSLLDRHLCQPYPPGSEPLQEDRLRIGSDPTLLARLAASQSADVAGRHFIYVEAGIKIRHLLEDLEQVGLALPTMGAGGGQSIAGVVSTSTHGADIDVPPLVDWVRAVQMIGPGGREWWVTPTHGTFASEAIAKSPDWCVDGEVLPDDDAFNALRTAVGRMGIIYALILEVVPDYGLVELNVQDLWPAVRNWLAVSGVADGKPAGIFTTALTDLDHGFGRSVVDTVEFPADKYWDPITNKGVPYDEDERHAGRLRDMDATAVADALRGGPSVPLRHLNIVVNLALPDTCWITRRWTAPVSIPRTNLETPESADADSKALAQALIDHRDDPRLMVEALQNLVDPDGEAATKFWFGKLMHDDVAERLDFFIRVDIPTICLECALNGGRSGEALFETIYRLLTDPVLRAAVWETVIRGLTRAIATDFAMTLRAGNSREILDTHNYAQDRTQSGDSVEYLFDGSGQAHLQFSDAVIALARKHAPVLGYLGMRFTPEASALIAMQRYSLTASVEVATGRVRQDDVYSEFWKDLHVAARTLGGIPHWGQEFRVPAEEIAASYGVNLRLWRDTLAEFSVNDPGLFMTTFSRMAGLEPTRATGKYLVNSASGFNAYLESAFD